MPHKTLNQVIIHLLFTYKSYFVKFSHLKKYNKHMDFSANLKKLLEEKDIQVKELASGTGISKNTIDNYLSGQKSLPNAENAIKIAQFLGVSAEFLVTGKTHYEKKHAALPELLLCKMEQLSGKDLESIAKIVDALSEKYI